MKIFFGVMIAVCLVFFAAASTVIGQDDNIKVETYVGYSYLNTDTGLDELDSSLDNRVGSHGVNASITGNVHRYIGIKGDFSFHNKSWNVVDGPDHVDIRFRTTQFLGGLQFKDNKVEGGRFRPFAHIMAGIAHQSLDFNGVVDGDPFDDGGSTNNFAMVWGGGVDMRVNNRVSVRVIQVDYNPIFFRHQDFADFTIPGRTQSNFRIGAGLVFH